ncbi:MAG: PLP-dependent aminotransferase family protein [Thermomicrobiales bacterium]
MSAQTLDLAPLYSQRAQQVSGAPLLQGTEQAAERITFTWGFPDADSLPAEEVAAAAVSALADRGSIALQYGDNAGYTGLIDALLAKLERDQGIRARRENVLITAGGSQALGLLLDALVDWGDTILSEMPTWLGAVKGFRNVGANVISLPVDEEGTDIAAVRREVAALRERGITPKFIYVISNFQNPTGITMTPQRRRELLAAAKEAGTLLIEDDAYFDLRYEGEHVPSIYSMDDGSTVVYMGTLSKTMGPGMRLGWLIGPPDLIRRLAALKIDGGTNIFGAHVAAEWLPRQLLPHVERLQAVYHRRRDIMLQALEQHMPPGTTWTHPEGGFFIWVTLPEGIDTVRMLPQVQELGVDYLPGPECFFDGSGPNQFRLSYSFVEDDRIEPGIRVIGEVAAAELREGASRSSRGA